MFLLANNPAKHYFSWQNIFVILKRFPSYRDSLCALHPKSYHYSVKIYYLFLCFGTSQHYLCYQAVPVMSLLHSIIDGDHSERTYKCQLQAYDLPTLLTAIICLSAFCLLYLVSRVPLACRTWWLSEQACASSTELRRQHIHLLCVPPRAPFFHGKLW